VLTGSLLTLLTLPPAPSSPYTPLFRSGHALGHGGTVAGQHHGAHALAAQRGDGVRRIRLDFVGNEDGAEERPVPRHIHDGPHARSEEHTSELQSRFDLVCRLLLEKKTQ